MNDEPHEEGSPSGAPEDAQPVARRRRKLPELEPENEGTGTTRLYRVFEVVTEQAAINTPARGTLTPIDQVAAVNDKDAIKAAIAEDRAGTFVAISERHYNERTRVLETVTREAWS